MTELISTESTETYYMDTAKASFLTSVEEANELSDALEVVASWVRRTQTALGKKYVGGSFQETDITIDFPDRVTVALKTGSIG